MKKRNDSLTIQKNTLRAQIPVSKRLSALLPGGLLLAGFWGTVLQELGISAARLYLLIPALLALTVGLVFCWEKKWQVWTALGMLAALGIGCILFRESLTASLAGVWELVDRWRFLRTGSFTPGYENAGSFAPVLWIGSVLSGFVTAFVLRMKNSWVQGLFALAALTGWAAGLITAGWWLALYLMGTLLAAAAYASGQGRTLTASGVIALVLAAVIAGSLLLTGYTPPKTAQGSSLERYFHQLRWEEYENPLPEGVLKDLGAYQPSDVPALEVTMDSWTPLYLRGYTAGRYTDHGWEPLTTDTLAQKAEELYALHLGYFYPVTQTDAASQAVEAAAENAVTVKNVGACAAYAYLPYGVGEVTENVLTPGALSWEGTYAPSSRQYGGRLFDIESSYLLQAELKDLTDSPYRMAEGTYREWVYENYLVLPQEVQDTLSACFAVDGEITTVQAKKRITEFLEESIFYDENVLTCTGQKDFLSYVLEVSKSGYSVHYATLAALMLRYCGIPARYVEGYVVTASQAEALSSGESLTLTDANAHAWAEYYLDGVGWLPFDTTPGYSDILTFVLPEDGLPTQENSGSLQKQEEQPEETPEKKPQVEQKESQIGRRIYVREAIKLLLMILTGLLLAVILRTFLLRRKLRRKQKGFASGDFRRACAGILCYLQELTFAVTSQRKHAVGDLANQIAGVLDGQVEADVLEALFNQVWYSQHPVSDTDVQQALTWLDLTKTAWKQKVSLPKRIKQRFITCKIL